MNYLHTIAATIGGGGGGTVRCGVAWGEANGKCGQKCESKDTECPAGEKCYKDLDASKCTAVLRVRV